MGTVRRLSLKAIELQVALPRTVDAGTQQNQLSQKGVQDQAVLAQELIKKKRELQQKSDKLDTEQHVKNENQGKQQGQDSKQRDQEKDLNDGESAKHPYKGKHIDLTL